MTGCVCIQAGKRRCLSQLNVVATCGRGIQISEAPESTRNTDNPRALLSLDSIQALKDVPAIPWHM